VYTPPTVDHFHSVWVIASMGQSQSYFNLAEIALDSRLLISDELCYRLLSKQIQSQVQCTCTPLAIETSQFAISFDAHLVEKLVHFEFYKMFYCLNMIYAYTSWGIYFLEHN